MSGSVTVLYNGDCPICAREIAHYARAAERSGAPLSFEPVAAADLAGWGLTPEAAVRRLHVRVGGRVVAGLPAFRAVWSALPGWRWLARLTGLPGIRTLAAALYDRVAAPMLHALHRRRVARGLCKVPRRA